ncbi:MAG TPA: YraN family protein [Acidimicrobiia bacterium]|nr:YraN family protein [Acidimicrobiia bacterium]
MPADRRRLDLGARGEDLVAGWYTGQGYEVLARNWRGGRDGELDLVVARGRCVVFCEVKTRAGAGFGAPVEAVTGPKQRRLRHLAARWLGEQGPGPGYADLRFDVASVVLRPGAAPVIEVIEAAF